MKKAILFLLLFLSRLYLFGQIIQPNPTTNLQPLGSPTTFTKVYGVLYPFVGLINAEYTDTVSANFSYIKNAPGSQIRVGDHLYMRSYNAQKWIDVSLGRFGAEDNLATAHRSFNSAGFDFTIQGVGKLYFGAVSTTINDKLTITTNVSGTQSIIQASSGQTLILKGTDANGQVEILPYPGGGNFRFFDDVANSGGIYQQFFSNGALEQGRIGLLPGQQEFFIKAKGNSNLKLYGIGETQYIKLYQDSIQIYAAALKFKNAPLTTDTTGKKVGIYTSNGDLQLINPGTLGSGGGGGSGGSVTSVATGYGLLGGTITGTGTIRADSAILSTYYLRRKDSSVNGGYYPYATNPKSYLVAADLSGYTPTSRTITINGTTFDISANRTWNVGTLTSISLTGSSAFTITGSPITTSGTLNISGSGTIAQYFRGNGTLATFPTIPAQFNPSVGLWLTQTGSYPNITTLVDSAGIATYFVRRKDSTDGGYYPYSSNPLGYLVSADLSGYVPTSRTININGVTQDLSSNRIWNVGTLVGADTVNRFVNYIYRKTASDSVFYFKGGVSVFAFKDSFGTGGSGVTTIGTINSQTKSANGAVIVGTSLYLQTVDATHPGLITSTSQARLDSNSYIHIDKSLDSLGWWKNDSTFYLKSINITINGGSATKTIKDSSILYTFTGIGTTYTASKSVLLTANDFTLKNDSTSLEGTKIYASQAGVRTWYRGIKIVLSSPVNGDLLKYQSSDTTLINFTPTYGIPAGNYGNVQLNRNGILGATDSLSMNSGKLTIKGTTYSTDTLFLGQALTHESVISFNGFVTGVATLKSDGINTTTIVLPSHNGTLATLTGTESFTNKTLTSSTNVLGGVTMTLGSDADGDTYVRSGNVLTRVPKGTAAQHYVGGTLPHWVDTAAANGGANGFVGDTTIGNTTNNDFLAGSIPANWANVGATLQFTGNGMTSSTVGSGFYGAYTKSKDTTASLNSIGTVEFVLNTKPSADTQGIVFGRFSTNQSQQFDYAVWLKRSTDSTWKAVLGLIGNRTDIQLVDSTSGSLPMVNGNKYRLVFNISNGFAMGRFSVLDSTKSGFQDEAQAPVSFKYRYDYRAAATKLIPNTGVGWISYRGGGYRVTKFQTYSGDLTRVDYAILTTSIGTRYSVYDVNNGWPAKVFNETRLRYALFGGGGDKLDDFIHRWQEIKATHPRYVIIDGAPNDANFGDVRQYGVRIIDSITSIGAVPIWLQITSNVDRDSTIFNICKEKNILRIPAFQDMTSDMYIDLTVHPNARGNEVVANNTRIDLTRYGYFTNSRSVQSVNLTDAVDHIITGRTDNFGIVFSNTDQMYHDVNLVTLNDNRYIKINGTGTAQTGASADVDGYLIARTGFMVGGYITNSYLANFIKNASGSQQGILISNSNASGGDYAGAEINVGGSGASNGWANAFYFLAYTSGGINFTAPAGPITMNTGGYGTTQFTLSTAGALRLHAYGAGALTADASGNITSVSDERVKNIQGFYRTGLDAVMNLHPISFKYKQGTGMETEHTYNGFSAQNVEQALGVEAIGINSQGFKSIQDRNILAALVNAIQDQQKEIDELKSKLKKRK